MFHVALNAMLSLSPLCLKAMPCSYLVILDSSLTLKVNKSLERVLFKKTERKAAMKNLCFSLVTILRCCTEQMCIFTRV